MGLEAADGLDDDVDVWIIENVVDVLCPGDAGGKLFSGIAGALAMDVAVVDVGELDAGKLLRAE